MAFRRLLNGAGWAWQRFCDAVAASQNVTRRAPESGQWESGLAWEAPAPPPEEQPVAVAPASIQPGDPVRVTRDWGYDPDPAAAADRTGEAAIYLGKADPPNTWHPHLVRFADDEVDIVAEIEPWTPRPGETVRIARDWAPDTDAEELGCSDATGKLATYVEPCGYCGDYYPHIVRVNDPEHDEDRLIDGRLGSYVHAVEPAFSTGVQRLGADLRGAPAPIPGTVRGHHAADVEHLTSLVAKLTDEVRAVKQARATEAEADVWRADVIRGLLHETVILRTVVQFCRACGIPWASLRIVPSMNGWIVQRAEPHPVGTGASWRTVHEQWRLWTTETTPAGPKARVTIRSAWSGGTGRDTEGDVVATNAQAAHVPGAGDYLRPHAFEALLFGHQAQQAIQNLVAGIENESRRLANTTRAYPRANGTWSDPMVPHAEVKATLDEVLASLRFIESQVTHTVDETNAEFARIVETAMQHQPGR